MYGTDDNLGLQPRMIQYLFDTIKSQSTQRTEYEISCQFFEIYNEQIIDLLSPRGENIITENIQTQADAMALLRKGINNRHVGETKMNIESSRSHSVFTILIKTSTKSKEGVISVRSSKLHFVDLAGSERQSKTEA